MALTQMNLLCLVFAVLCAIPYFTQAMPAERGVEDKEDERRATWLETRESSEDELVQVVYEALQQLVKKGLVNPDAILVKSEEKRGRHQGFCFRKTKSGRFLPYICWKDGDAEATK